MRIDFQAVAKEFGLSVPAARMRLRRLDDALGVTQSGKVSKPESATMGRRTQRNGKTKAGKEGLETKWKGAEDEGDDDDDDVEEVAVGKKEGHGGKVKKEESADDHAWKMLPEPSASGSSLGEDMPSYDMGAYEQAATMPPPPTAANENCLQAQSQMPLHPAMVQNYMEGEDRSVRSLEGYTYSTAHVALPQAIDHYTSPASYQIYDLQYESLPQSTQKQSLVIYRPKQTSESKSVVHSMGSQSGMLEVWRFRMLAGGSIDVVPRASRDFVLLTSQM